MTCLCLPTSLSRRLLLPRVHHHLHPRSAFSITHRPFSIHRPPSTPPKRADAKPDRIYTFPNLLTISRIAACPFLGWSILDGHFSVATCLLVYAGLTDVADGWLARRYDMRSVFGTILDPAADKILMTTLAITLTVKGLVPLPLTVIILGRDLMLSVSAFYIRYTSLPHPKTVARYWDFSVPSAEVRPTGISKVNTALQLLLMGSTTVSPLLNGSLHLPLLGLQWVVAATTIWSGLSYLLAKDGFRVLSQRKKPSP